MLIHSWRWFGPGDRISLDQIRQAGAGSIVTALHQIPAGETWPADQIMERKRLIEASGLQWTVVESVPVHEEIKRGTHNKQRYIENYKQTLINLARENIRTVCYNFMPVLDWSRTNLQYRSVDGSVASSFDYSHFAAIDMFILKRPGAEKSYPEDLCQQAAMFYRSLDDSSIERLTNTFLLGLPGSGETFTLQEIVSRIEGYRDIDKQVYQSNLMAFIEAIVPVAEEEGLLLAMHPDDPPWPLMGLPRAVSTLEDAEKIIAAVDTPSNGITFCTGSFGAASTNDIPLMADKLAHRINFAHLRNVSRDDQSNFREENLFDGDVDMYRIIKTLVLEDQKRLSTLKGYMGIPLRPDHGASILGDLNEDYYPGYSLYGRMKNLAEIRGLEIGIRNSLKEGRV